MKGVPLNEEEWEGEIPALLRHYAEVGVSDLKNIQCPADSSISSSQGTCRKCAAAAVHFRGDGRRSDTRWHPYKLGWMGMGRESTGPLPEMLF